MGYDQGVLLDEAHPILPFKKGDIDWLPKWRKAHTPHLWMQNSCVWYSQKITR